MDICLPVPGTFNVPSCVHSHIFNKKEGAMLNRLFTAYARTPDFSRLPGKGLGLLGMYPRSTSIIPVFISGGLRSDQMFVVVVLTIFQSLRGLNADCK